MNAYEKNLHGPMTCYCVRSQNFPTDAKQCHQRLHSMVKFDTGRNYMGLSKFKSDGRLEYLAACTEMYPGELEHLGLEKIEIPAGVYLCADLEDYMNRIDQISVLFGELIKDPRFDREAWAIEWYGENLCACMVPLK